MLGIALTTSLLLTSSIRLHFLRLLGIAWHNLLTATGTTTLGFILWTLALTAVGWSAPVAARWQELKQENHKTPLRQALLGSFRPGMFLAAGVCGLVVFAFSISVIYTIYHDHRFWTSENRRLVSENRRVASDLMEARNSSQSACSSKDNEIGKLREKLNAQCYWPDRHLTEEQRDHAFTVLKGLAKDLRKSGIKPTVTLGSIFEDKEAQNFMTELWHLFQDAGWEVTYPNKRYKEQRDWILQHAGNTGIIVLDKAIRTNSGLFVADLFGRGGLGFDVGGMTPVQLKDAKELDEFTIWIGYKSSPWNR